MSHRIYFLFFAGFLPIFCSCRKDTNRFEWKVDQRHMEVSLKKEYDSLMLSIWIQTVPVILSGNYLILSINLIMVILPGTVFPKL